MTTPSATLAAPTAQTLFPSTLEEFLNLGDLISPSFYIRKGIELVLGVDPVEEITSAMAGDWEAVSKAGSALTQLGQYVNDLGSAVRAIGTDLDGAWDGNAGEQAVAYFTALSETVAGFQEQLDEIAHQFQSTATGINNLGGMLCDLISVFLDYLVEIGIAACATGAFAWTGVGAAIGGAGTAYLVYKAGSTWMKIVEALGLASTIVKGAVGLTAGPLSLLHLDSSFTLPGGNGYDHPGVDR